MDKIATSGWFLKKAIPTIGYSVSKSSTLKSILRPVSNLDTFGKSKGVEAQEDLKKLKQLSFYEQGNRVCYYLAKDDEGVLIKPDELASIAVKHSKNIKAASIAIEVPEEYAGDGTQIGKFAYSADLSNYEFDVKSEHTKEAGRRHFLESLEIVDSKLESSNLDFQFYSTIGKCKNLARKIVNARINFFSIKDFTEQARLLASQHKGKVELKIWEENQLLDGGFNLLHSVGKGSYHRPAMIDFVYKGNPEDSTVHALVGKGIVFDCGGLNIKPTGFMETMYTDKGGAGAVFGAFKGIVELGMKVNVSCTIPLAENFVSSTSYRPSDIIRSRKGITVEIGNTDAEGRLILADAMNYAQEEYKPKSLIELSTLTGACMVALGTRTAGLFSNNDILAGKLSASGEKIGEPMWRLPIPQEIKDGLRKGYSSDCINSTKVRYGGASEAAAFLEQFVEQGVEWAHVDIAGPSDTSSPYGNYNTGATGFGVGFLLEHFRNLSNNL